MLKLGTIIKLQTKPGVGRSLEAAVVLARINDVKSAQWEAVRFRKGVLTIEASTPLIAQDLVLRQGQLLKTLNNLFDQETIQRLVIRTQPLPRM